MWPIDQLSMFINAFIGVVIIWLARQQSRVSGDNEMYGQRSVWWVILVDQMIILSVAGVVKERGGIWLNE